MTTLRTKIEHGEFAITAEIVPPQSASKTQLLEEAEALRGIVDAINVTDGAGAATTMSSFAASALLAASGFEPVLQITCRDRNRIALTGDLLGAAAQGCYNLLILMGDDPAKGDQPDAKAVFDLDSRDVMRVATQLRVEGKMPSGKTISEHPPFFVGAADMPLDPPADWKPTGLQAKIDAGAEFAQTQFCFEPDVAQRYISRLNEEGITSKLSVLLGIGPILSAKSARWMNEHLYGVTIPQPVIKRLEQADNAKLEGMKICAELIQQYREIPGLAGVHIMAPAQKSDAIAQTIALSR
ncbi:MAG: methylenetetrahydrofolate reductase [Granulosicoccus sp.]|nr:methylenetetrahydrofolate reductase [Granulosicoccus sp.]